METERHIVIMELLFSYLYFVSTYFILKDRPRPLTSVGIALGLNYIQTSRRLNNDVCAIPVTVTPGYVNTFTF